MKIVCCKVRPGVSRGALSLGIYLLVIVIMSRFVEHSTNSTNPRSLDFQSCQVSVEMKRILYDSSQPKKMESDVSAESKYNEAEKLRTEQLEQSNRRAVEKYKEAAELWRKDKPRQAASALRNAGEILQILSDTKTALLCFKESLELSRNSLSPLEESKALNSMANLYFISGNAAAARQYSFAALRIAKGIRQRAVEAQAISNIGETFFSSGDLGAAQKYQQQALALWRDLSDKRGQAQAYLALGYYFANVSELGQALDSYQRSLDLSLGTNDLRGQAVALNAIGSLKSKVGDRQEAFEAYAVARPLAQQIGDRIALASILGGIGYVYFGLGDKEKALEYVEQGTHIFELLDERWGTAEGKMDLGRIYHSLGRDREALDVFTEALTLSKSLAMPRLEAQTLRDIGLVYSSLGDRSSALRSYEQALRLIRVGQDQRQEAYTLNYIGEIYQKMGDRHGALEYYRRALPLSRMCADPAGEALTLYNTARLERDRGNLTEAQRQIETVISIAESLRAKVSNHDLRASYLATVRQNYELYIEILMMRHKERPLEGFAAEAFAISERARARSFLDSLNEAQTNVREGVSATLLDKERQLNEMLNAKAERQMQLLSKKDKVEAQKVGDEVEALTSEYSEVQAQIRATSPRYAALTIPQPLTSREIQEQVLDNNSILLEYALGEERSYVWLVSRNAISVYELAPRAEIEASAQRLYQLFTAYQLIGGEPLAQRLVRQSRAAEAIPSEIARLSRLVLGPLSGKLGNKRLLIIADGALQYIPFQSLSNPDLLSSSPQPLLANHEIVYEPSASTLAVLLKESAERKSADNTVAVLADPVFEEDDPRIRHATEESTPISAETLELRKAVRDIGISDGGEIPRLFASGDEADAIMAAVPWGTGLKAVGFSASRARVLDPEMARYRIIHFATHGLINNKHPELSGIVLSLFDQQGRALDGFLRLHDIYNLRLPADLVVLSACSTGLGKDVKGEGLIGLTRGFMYAGASGVIASLWKVDDEATAELMKLFYHAMFNKGLSPAAALRDSQLAMSGQQRWQAPYYWAGFVIQGQYLEKESARPALFLTGKRYAVFGAVIGILLLTSILIIIRRRRSRII